MRNYGYPWFNSRCSYLSYGLSILTHIMDVMELRVYTYRFKQQANRMYLIGIDWQGSKFHSSDRLRRVKMTVRQVEYLQDLSDGRLHISDFHISYIGFIYFRQVNDTFGQVIFTIHLPDGQVHSIWNFKVWLDYWHYSIESYNWTSRTLRNLWILIIDTIALDYTTGQYTPIGYTTISGIGNDVSIRLRI